MKTIGYMIQDSHGKWLVEDRAGYYWDATARMGAVVSIHRLPAAWKVAVALSNDIKTGLTIFEWRRGKVENRASLKAASYIYWPLRDQRYTMVGIDKIWGIYHPSSITNTKASYWAVDLFGDVYKPTRVYKGSEQDLLVRYYPSQRWFTE